MQIAKYFIKNIRVEHNDNERNIKNVLNRYVTMMLRNLN